MKLLSILILLVGSALAQSADFSNLYNGLAVKTYTLPIGCPSTAGNCNGTGLTANQALTGANTVFPECDLNPSPQCPFHALASRPYNSNYVHYVRVTDQNTGGVGTPQNSYHPNPSQGAGDNNFDATDTRFMATKSGGTVVIFQFDPNPADDTTTCSLPLCYLQTTKLYGSGWSLNAQAATFSVVLPTGNPTVSPLYAVQNASNVPGLVGTLGVSATEYVLMAYDFSSTSTPPTLANAHASLLADFNILPNCLPSTFLYDWHVNHSVGVLSVSDDDQTFSIAVGNLNNLSVPQYAIVWNRTLGCTTYNTQTGIVTKFGGGTGTATDPTNNQGLGGIAQPALYMVHETQIFHDGGKVYIQDEGCETGQNCNGTPTGVGSWHIWETGVPYPGNATPTGLVVWNASVNSDGALSGHSTQGYNVIINKAIRTNTDGAMTYFEVPYNHPYSPNWSFLNPKTAGGTACYQVNSATLNLTCPSDDQHTSWHNNLDGTDTAPYFSYTTAVNGGPTPSSSTVPDVPYYFWDNELLVWNVTCVPNCTGNVPRRIAHSYSDAEVTHAAAFADYYAVGSVSARPAYGQYFYAITSNWQDQLGCNDGTYSSSQFYAGCPGGHTGGRYDMFLVTIPTNSLLLPRSFFNGKVVGGATY